MKNDFLSRILAAREANDWDAVVAAASAIANPQVNDVVFDAEMSDPRLDEDAADELTDAQKQPGRLTIKRTGYGFVVETYAPGVQMDAEDRGPVQTALEFDRGALKVTHYPPDLGADPSCTVHIDDRGAVVSPQSLDHWPYLFNGAEHRPVLCEEWQPKAVSPDEQLDEEPAAPKF